MVDGKSVVKYFGCCSFKPARGAKQIAPASKDKWVENWYRYWFIIMFLWSKRRMKLTELLDDILWLQ
jgi:hypothetical protein